MSREWLVLAGLLVGLLSNTVLAGVEVHQFDNPAQEQQYKHLTNELRCLVCQNQNLADSNADLAQDLRQEIYEMIQQGKSNQEIIDFMVARYGDFVLYRPPVKSTTLFLWIGPFLILGIGIVILLFYIRGRRTSQEPALDTAQHERAQRLLQDEDEKQS
ncbi:MAG: cytochrome c-type biogenesis protein CcmH [Proteobacteria bacterium]|jgi:cytochrome c-type biogenesis protein CcmH|nr:cytochrome c-type biogenesis protein CcmH [Pseudomonadota bacterium]MCG6936227.1 cytochrome c-type biogenesis protein CcmH [Pseudomonadota bacterium]